MYPSNLSLACLFPCYVIPENSLKLNQKTIFPGKTWIHIGKICTLLPNGIFCMGNLEYSWQSNNHISWENLDTHWKNFHINAYLYIFLGKPGISWKLFGINSGINSTAVTFVTAKKYQLASCIEHLISVSI